VLADNMQDRTCREYCSDQLMDCVGAWEDEGDHCHNVKETLTCDETYPHTSDLLCECAPSQYFRAQVVRASGDNNRTLVWSDEFDGEELDSSKWNVVHGGGGFGNNEKQFYRGENAKLSDGVLSIEAKCDNYAGENYTSSKLHTLGKGDWGPGHRVEVRARLPTGKGVWPAIWMLPSTREYTWPKCGEIDIMEAVGCTQGKVYGTIHTEAYNHMHHTEKSRTKKMDVTEWHTYSIDWTEAGLTWFVDGEVYHRFAPSAKEVEKWPFDQKFHLILNLAVGGSWGGMCVHNAPSCSTEDEFGHSQVMQVDFARVYEINGI
jgi:beta-glucanase (GH16 family)